MKKMEPTRNLVLGEFLSRAFQRQLVTGQFQSDPRPARMPGVSSQEGSMGPGASGDCGQQVAILPGFGVLKRLKSSLEPTYSPGLAAGRLQGAAGPAGAPLHLHRLRRRQQLRRRTIYSYI